MLHVVRRKFSDDVLRAACLITGPAETPQLNRLLAPRTPGTLLPVAEPVGGRIVDLSTPGGILSSSAIPPFTVPLCLAPSTPFPVTGFIFATVDPAMATFLFSLGLRTVLMRGVQRMRRAELEQLGRFQVTAVPGCLELVSEMRRDTGRRQCWRVEPAAMPPLLVVLGCSFLARPWRVPARMRVVMRIVDRVQRALGLDLVDRFVVSAPGREHSRQLRELLRFRDPDLIREWFYDAALRACVSPVQYAQWLESDAVVRSQEIVRREIRNLLAGFGTWSSYTVECLQRLHEEWVAAIERDIVEPLHDEAAEMGDIRQGLHTRMLATALRVWMIVEPYADTGALPRQFRLGLELGGRTIQQFTADAMEQVRELTDFRHKVRNRRS